MKTPNKNLKTVPDDSNNPNIVNVLFVVIRRTRKIYEWPIGYLKSMYDREYCKGRDPKPPIYPISPI